MRAVVYQRFKAPLELVEVADPVAERDDVVVKVEASGICRSDWHGWMGHDAEITSMPHVPGHELAGVIAEVGKNVTQFEVGERVTVPFVSGCGECPECQSGNQQVCDNQYQPGFSGWGSFAEYVSIRFADTNLVRLPDDVEFVTAACLGCRFGTSFRAVVDQGEVQRGDWVAVHGCGGVGLSAVMIAHALGARVVAVDVEQGALDRAGELGATTMINAAENEDVAGSIRHATERGAHVSLDAFGSAQTCANSILCLRKRGRHVQVGLLAGDDYLPRLPMDQVIARELELYGSHGIGAARYDAMLRMIVAGDLEPRRIIGKTISLEEAPGELAAMNDRGRVGITVIDRF